MGQSTLLERIEIIGKMAHLQYSNIVTDVIRMDGPLHNVPAPRWQRKAEETLLRLHPSDNGISSPMKLKNITVATPDKNCQTPRCFKTPNNSNPVTPRSTSTQKESKTPKVTPGKRLTGRTTPSKKAAVTPGKQQDRFIPNRITTNQEMSHFALVNSRSEEEDEFDKSTEYQQQLTEAMLPRQGLQAGTRILNYKNQCSVQDQPNNLHVLYTTGKMSVTKPSKATRQIPNKPESVLDAPMVLDDFYWSSTNALATALGTDVYLWNATNSTITLLMNVESGDYISSVSWISDGSVLGVGLSNGSVQIWDVTSANLIRTMLGHTGRVGCLTWNTHILSSGSRTGNIHHHDVRVATHHVATLTRHSQEVCGLCWSPDGQYLASGGNDNAINIWDATLGMEVVPLHTFTAHQAAVKAVSWCPWQLRLLASGGGTNDRHIRFWNTSTGTCIKTVDTQSQVCSVLWSEEHRELVSGHGYAMNQLSLWKYPSMTKIADLIGHSGRILHLSMSPDGQTIASIAADETIRLWKCFASVKKEKKVKVTASAGNASGLSMSIR